MTSLPATATGATVRSDRAIHAHATPGWLDRTLRNYTWTLIGVTALLAVAVAAAAPSIAMQTLVMLALVATIGLPHGSFDIRVGSELLRERLGLAWAPVFCLAYLAAGGAALAVWLYAPWVGLATLLLLGAAHWGADDLEHRQSAWLTRTWLAMSRGLVPVATPLVAHAPATAEIFAALTSGGSVAPGLVRATGFFALACAAPGLIVQAIRMRRAGGEQVVRSVAEVLVLLAWFIVVPPLLAFTVYFCLWHAVRHTLRSAARLEPRVRGAALRRYGVIVVGPTIATWAIALIAWRLMQDTVTAPVAAWRLVFIGLFALTIPHVLLEMAADRAPRG